MQDSKGHSKFGSMSES